MESHHGIKKLSTIQEDIFKGIIFIKGLNGIIELIGASLIFLFGSQHAVRAMEHMSHSTQNFVAFYIGIHGLINLFLFTVVWKKKVSFYPIAIIIMMTLIAYQIFRFSIKGSYVLLVITIIDMVFVYFVAHEYVRIRHF